MIFESMRIGQVTCDFIRLEDFLGRCRLWVRGDSFHHVVTLNPEMVVQAERDVAFRQATQAADLRVPDGAGLIWAQWYVRSEFWSLFWSLVSFSFRNVERITGVDTVKALSSMATQEGKPIYLLGGTNYQVVRTAALLQKRLPTLQVTVAPPHKFTLAGGPDILADIQKNRPALLLVAYGAPYQTVWIERHRAGLASAGVRLAIGVGGAFAILSEERRRAPKWLRQLNGEWLWRLWLEPKRLPRIWRAVVEFPFLVHRQKEHHPPASL